MDWMSLTRFVIALSMMTLASYSDWRTRTAADRYWVVMGGVGLVLLTIQIYEEEVSALYYLFLLPVGWLFLDMLWDRRGLFEEGVNWLPFSLYLASGACLVVLTVMFYDSAFLWELYSILVMFLIFYLLYIFDVIKGGADAKALIALSLLMPVYPVLGSLPLIDLPTEEAQFIMPFSLLVLFYGALLTLVIPLYYLFYNLGKGDRRFPTMLFGLRMDIEEARKRHVWPMEYLEGEEVKVSTVPHGEDDLEAHYAALKAKGLEGIWVTPKIPMLIPLTAGMVLAVVLGNILFIFL